jgi:O-succinylbenzoic acid--CoA ligase
MQVEAWLRRASRSTPTVTAVETPEERLSYAELFAAACAGAGEMRDRGVRRGERVAIALPPGVDFAVALHACFLLGAVAVPVDLRLTAAERDHVGGGALVLVDVPLARGPSEGAGRFEGGEGEGLTVARTHDLDATCVVIHTSGTTSAPRPVELTYGNFLWSALGSGVALGVDPAERWLCPALPLSHVGGLSILVRSAIYATTAVIHERFDTQRALTALMEQDMTLVSLVSTTLSRLLDAGLSHPPRLRYALTGGGPVPDALVERARKAGVPVAPTYGLTEACSQVTTNGPPLFCTRVSIEQEEIVVAGPTVARGALAADGRLHTGDLGYLDDRGHGHLHVSGRVSDTIVTGGENVSPSEVEGVLESHPSVCEAAVVGRVDDQWGEMVVAVVLPAEGDTVDAEDLRAHCAAQLAPFKVPKRVEFACAPLPRTRSGKLLRREL